MSVTVTFEGDSHADVVRQVREWLSTVEDGEDHLSTAQAIEQGGALYKDALRIIAAAAPQPVGQSEVVKSLTDMGYRATDATTTALIEGMARIEEVSGGAIVKDTREAGRSAVYEMNSTIAKQLLKALGGR